MKRLIPLFFLPLLGMGMLTGDKEFSSEEDAVKKAQSLGNYNTCVNYMYDYYIEYNSSEDLTKEQKAKVVSHCKKK